MDYVAKSFQFHFNSIYALHESFNAYNAMIQFYFLVYPYSMNHEFCLLTCLIV